MYKKLLVIIALTLAVTSSPLLVYAQEDSIDPNLNTVTETQSQESEDVTAETKAEQRAARIQALKDKKQERITQLEQKRITQKCKPAQNIIDKLQSSMNKVVENRKEKYGNLTSKLSELSTKLLAAGVDTTELDSAITEIEMTISDAILLIENYNTSLSDIAAMDCESDPEGFKLTLDEARVQRTEIISLQGTLRSGVNEKIKPLLDSIKLSLQDETVSEEGGEQ